MIIFLCLLLIWNEPRNGTSPSDKSGFPNLSEVCNLYRRSQTFQNWRPLFIKDAPWKLFLNILTRFYACSDSNIIEIFSSILLDFLDNLNLDNVDLFSLKFASKHRFWDSKFKLRRPIFKKYASKRILKKNFSRIFCLEVIHNVYC